MRCRTHFSVALLVAAGLASSCARQTKTDKSGGDSDKLASAAQREAAKPAGKPDLSLAPPPTIAPNVKPLTGDDLGLAQLPLESIVARLPVPEYLKTTDSPAAEEEPDPVALKHYLLGRDAFMADNFNLAERELEEARKLQPRSTEILRMLGTVYFARRNEARGSQYLAQAVKLRPDDAQSLFFLGSAAYKRRNWDEAIAVLSRGGGKNVDEEPALRSLQPYYLGQALLQKGYLAAGIKQIELYLQTSPRLGQVPRMFPEVALLERQRGRMEQEVGDALCRLGHPEEALSHYQNAAGDEVVDADALAVRTIYAYLATRRPRAAEQALVDRLREGGGDPIVALVSYLADHSGDRKRLAALLKSVYEQSDRPAALAIAVSELLPSDAAATVLLDHLNHRPGDTAAVQRLVTRLGVADTRRLVTAFVQLIRQRPESARDYAAELFKGYDDPGPILAELNKLTGSADSAAASYLRGAAYEQSNQIERAAQAYDRAIAADPSFLSPRLANVELQARIRRYDRAMELLDKLPNASSDPQAALLRARIYTVMRRYDEALKVLDALLREHPRDTNYLLEKANIQYLARRFEEAENTLNSVLSKDPTNEAAYASMFRLLNHRDNPRYEPRKLVEVLQRAARAIPSSPVTRVQMALYEYSVMRNAQKAESILKDLLAERPDETGALSYLVVIDLRESRADEAVDLIVNQLNKRPRDPAVLQVAVETVANDDAGLLTPHYDRLVRAIAQPPLTPEKVNVLARLNIHRKRYDEALKVLDEGIAKFPGRSTEFHYERAGVLQNSGDASGAESELAKVLEIDPEHPAANNDLAYLWADQNRNLDRVLEMVTKAVKSEPTNGSFLDSLGWVFYKRGEFAAAAQNLEKAIQNSRSDNPATTAVIRDHLADTLWRLGKKDEAKALWKQALDALGPARGEEDGETTKLRVALDAKFKAAIQNRDPPVAEVPDNAKDPPPKARTQPGPASKP